MKPVVIRERLHLLINVLPSASLNEIYFLLGKTYPKECKPVFLNGDEEISKVEADLLVQQLLA